MSERSSPSACPDAMAMAFVPLPRAAEPPRDVLLLPFGALDLKARSCGFPAAFLADADAVIAGTLAHVRLFQKEGVAVSFDYLPESIDETVPAAGRVAELSRRADGIWGRIDWSARARVHFAQRAFAAIGTVFTHRRGGEIECILGVALVPPRRQDRRERGPTSPQPHGVLSC